MKLSSVNNTFNARHLNPEEVAQTFIYSTDFEELAQNNHTVLLGARGCGKTTLMKMLTLPALKNWEAPEAKEISRMIKFFPVYISTDIYWNAQNDSYKEQLRNFPKYSDLVSKTSITLNIFYALCEAFEYVLKYENSVENIESREISLAKNLIESWLLPPTVPTLRMVKEALLIRLDKLNRHIQETLFNFSTDDDLKEEKLQRFFFLDFDSSTTVAISAFERIYQVNPDKKWALCFDELELAPKWLQERLFTSLRSRNQKFLYKLSASPIISISNRLLATPGNDLKLIKMWPHLHGKKYEKFCEDLANSVIKSRLGGDFTIEEIFGSNTLFRRDVRDDYSKGGETWKEIKKLAIEDVGLKELLLKHKIDPEDPSAFTGDKRKMDTVLRKIKPIVFFRNYYSTFKNGKSKRLGRSRKISSLFYGKEVLVRISDGNPRWLIGIINEMLSRKKSSEKKISPAVQAQVFQNVAEQFNNVVKTIPGTSVETNGKMHTLSGMLEEIGKGIFNEIVLENFRMDPRSTFIIDKEVGDEFLKLLEKGIYQGAIIITNPSTDSFDFELRGKEFRLSYLYAPKFKIPLRKYNSIKLSSVFTGEKSLPFQSSINFN